MVELREMIHREWLSPENIKRLIKAVPGLKNVSAEAVNNFLVFDVMQQKNLGDVMPLVMGAMPSVVKNLIPELEEHARKLPQGDTMRDSYAFWHGPKTAERRQGKVVEMILAAAKSSHDDLMKGKIDAGVFGMRMIAVARTMVFSYALNQDQSNELTMKATRETEGLIRTAFVNGFQRHLESSGGSALSEKIYGPSGPKDIAVLRRFVNRLLGIDRVHQWQGETGH